MTRIGIIVGALIFFGILNFAIVDCARGQREYTETYQVRYALKLRVSPGHIRYTALDGTTWDLTIPPEASVTLYRSDPGKPLKIEWRQMRGRPIMHVHVPEGYPTYEDSK